VSLKKGLSLYERVSTDSDGRFSFRDMDPGQWAIEVTVPAGMEVLYPSNPQWLVILQNTQLELPFAMVTLPTPTPTATRTPTPTASSTLTPTATPSTRYNYVPLVLGRW